MTGRYTLPVLTTMTAETLSVEDGKPFVHVQVDGLRLDENAMPHDIGQGFADNPDFEYVWTIYDRGGNPQKVSSGSASNVTTKFQDWGCYYIDVTVKDRGVPAIAHAVLPDRGHAAGGRVHAGERLLLVPLPEPRTERHLGIVGLDPAPGQGTMANERPIEFRVLVAPKYSCEGMSGPAVFLDDVEIQRLAVPQIPIPSRAEPQGRPPPGAGRGARGHGPLLGRLRGSQVPAREDRRSRRDPDHFGRRQRRVPHRVLRRQVRTSTTTRTARGSDVNPDDVGHPLARRCASTNHRLRSSVASGREATTRRPTRTTSACRPANSSRQGFPIGASEEVPLPIEGAPQEISIPSYDNDVTTGFNPVFKMHQETFEAVDGAGGTFGECFGNQVEGAAVTIKPTVVQSAALGGPGGSFPTYEWDDCRTIFSNETQPDPLRVHPLHGDHWSRAGDSVALHSGSAFTSHAGPLVRQC